MGILAKIGAGIVGAYALGFGLLLLANPGSPTLLKPEVMTPLIVMAFVLLFVVRVLAWGDRILEGRT